MGDIRHGDHLLAERIDGDVDRTPGFHLDTPAGQLLEDDAALVGRDEQRIVDLQLEVVLAASRCASRRATPEKSGTVRRAWWRVPICMTTWATTARPMMMAAMSSRL